MNIASALPAAALLAGAGFGLFRADSIRPDAFAFRAAIILCGAAAVAAFICRSTSALARSVAAGFFAGGVILTAHAWRQAWRPSLRIVFERAEADWRADADAHGQRLPEEVSIPIVVSGTLTADASSSDAGVSVAVDVTSAQILGSASVVSVQGGVLLTVVGDLARDRADRWRAGRPVRAPAQLHRPARYLDPGIPDEERVLARRGTTLVGTVKSGALIEVLGPGSFVAEWAARLRAYSRCTITGAVAPWSPRAAGIVTAIVIGDRGGLSEDVQRSLQEAGTYHVIAISGGNIAILVGLTLGVFRITGLLGRVALGFAIAGLVAYGYLVGGGASVDRATLMAVVYLGARLVDLRGPPLNTLAVVAALLVAWQPLIVADPSFLLTFGATAAILAVTPAVDVQRFGRLGGPVVSMFVASAAAECALIPISATVFSRVTFAGLALNFVAIPLMAVAQCAGMLIVPLAAVSARAALFVGWIAFVGAEGLVRSASLVQWTPALAWRVAPPAWPAVVCYYAGLLAMWGLATRRLAPAAVAWRLLRAAAVGTTVAAGVWIVAEPWQVRAWHGDGRLHVTFIDVGQGDGAFVQLPHGHVLLVDTGGLSARSTFDIGDRIVAPVLRQAGTRRISVLLLTHGDADHIGGALSLVPEFRPGDVWEGIPVPPFKPLQALRLAAAAAGSRWTNVHTLDETVVDDVRVVVRHPDVADWERQKVRNDDSVVIELLWRTVSIVLTGDIGREVESQIAGQFMPSPLRVVKVPHHGSLTSSSEAFVRALSPRVAVISVGRSNPFGHPAPQVLERYRLAGAEIFRTDRDGAVRLDTDGEWADVETFTGRRVHLAGGGLSR